jgi:hypothetical protein
MLSGIPLAVEIARGASQPHAESHVNFSRLWLAWLIGTAIAWLPLLVAPIPPLRHHFFHLVRMEILADPATYARDFVIRWEPIPDLAMDLTVPWLAKLIGIAPAVRAFLFATLALLTSGTLMLSRVVNRRWSMLPLLSFLILYNWILVRGYENNLFGLGLALWALAAHISLRPSTVARVLVSISSALIIYFCHLFALGVFALVAGTWELGCLLQEGITRRRFLDHAAAAMLPFLLPALLLGSSSTGQLGGAIEFGLFSVVTKLKLCVVTLTIGNVVADAVLLLGLGIAGLLAITRGWLRCEPEVRLTIIVLPVVALLAPFHAFASYGVVDRCGIGFAFVLIALLGGRVVNLRLQRTVAAILVVLFLVRIATVTADWRTAERMIQTYRQTFASFEPGSVLLQFDQDTGYPSPLQDPRRWNPPLDNIIELATLDGILVPELPLQRGQQPVLYRTERETLRAFQLASDERRVFVADDAMLRAWANTLHARFPDLQRHFRAVYIAVYDPRRLLTDSFPGARLIATLPQHRLYKLLERN